MQDGWLKSVLKAYPAAYDRAKRLAAALGRPVYRPQEAWLADFADGRRDVFFVQIGAHDGKTNDKIHPMVRERGWRGVLVEPVRALFDRLVANYAGVPGLAFENAALTSADGPQTFYHMRPTEGPMPEWYDQIGSLDRDVILSHKAAIPDIEDHLMEETVAGISFATLAGRHRFERVDMILVDTEGFDFEVLKNIDFQRYRPTLVIYEHKHLSVADKAAAVRLLGRHGYTVNPCGENNVAVRSWLRRVFGLV